MSPLLSIIIVNYNTKDLLQQCLNSLFEAVNSKSQIPCLRRQGNYKQYQNLNDQIQNMEIIIIDNNSHDGSKEFLKELNSKSQIPNPKSQILNKKKRRKSQNDSESENNRHSGIFSIPQGIAIKTIFNKTNLGFAKANNQGIRIARGKYILLLNSDTIVKKGALEKMVGYLEKHGDVAAVSPRLLNPDGSFQQRYYMRFPNLWQMAFYHSLAGRWLVTATPLKWLVFSQVSKMPTPVEQLPGAALLARRTVWQKTKGLDEDYFFFFEDVDWSYRVKKLGLGKLVVVPAAEIIHFGGGSWKNWKMKERWQFYRRYFASLFLFLRKHHYPLWLYRLVLSFTFLGNAFAQLLRERLTRAKVQWRLWRWLWDF